MKLRQVFVQEITGERRNMYEDFIEKGDLAFDYVAEANKFLEDGFFASSHRDLMPLAMATYLQASIIITTNVNSTPMYVLPMVGSAERSVFVLYTPTGPGHYDAAIPALTPKLMERPVLHLCMCTVRQLQLWCQQNSVRKNMCTQCCLCNMMQMLCKFSTMHFLVLFQRVY